MSIFDFFTREAGQERRRALEGLLTQFIPPEMRPQLGLLAEANPVVSMERAGQDAQQLFAPDQTIMDRIASLGRMSSNIAGTVAPTMVASRAALPAAQALQEGLTGVSTAVQPFMVDEFGGVGLPRAVDAAAERGAQIMDMLRSGRSADVTDAMLDMGDPVLNARLNEYLYRNYDLPMDAASRAARAAERGAKEGYRGDKDLLAFMEGQGKQAGIGVTMSDSPSVANSYVARGESVYPLYNMGERGAIIDAEGRNWKDILPSSEMRLTSGREMPLSDVMPPEQFLDDVQRAELEHFLSTGERLPDSDFGYTTDDIARYMKSRGADYTSFQNIVDPGAYSQFKTREANLPATTTMVANPANVRSRFARFDPRLSHLRNLNAAMVAGVPLGLLAMQPQEEQY